MASLIYTGPGQCDGSSGRPGLGGRGVPGDELLRRNGLPQRNRGDDDPLGEIVYVSATLA